MCADERGRKRIKDVDAKASAQLVHTGEKLGTVETGLHLLHALLGPHPLAPAAIFAVTQANGVQVRALVLFSVESQAAGPMHILMCRRVPVCQQRLKFSYSF